MAGSLRPVVALLALLGILMAPALAPAKTSGRPTKYAALVVDARTGAVLFERFADAPRYPASLAKIMTLYLAFEALDNGTLTMATKVPVSAAAAAQPPSKLGLVAGTSVSIGDLIGGLVTKSANDAAVVMAEALAGNEATFARQMTAMARRLGMARTTFRNASGLPDARQRTTARDLVILARALLNDFPHHYPVFATESFRYKKHTFRNHNRLLGSYAGTDGIKTGYINASGFNLVASAEHDGRRVIGVVFGGKTAASRDAHMAVLLDRGFAALGVGAPTRAAPKPAPRHVREDADESKPVPASIPRGEARAEGGWAIQVGAFKSQSQARRQAEAARTALAELSDGAHIIILGPVKRVTRYYRARLAGLDALAAGRACERLARKRMDCLPIRPEAALAEGDR
ncbi:MAG: D-alanyl-D-alanine carboxypeptidase [Alphaproteobacteria bacterium]|nr:D-alanyl-D-alanine carboxypeptidase [Alphaproteobacteria bacterium]